MSTKDRFLSAWLPLKLNHQVGALQKSEKAKEIYYLRLSVNNIVLLLKGLRSFFNSGSRFTFLSAYISGKKGRERVQRMNLVDCWHWFYNCRHKKLFQHQNQPNKSRK